MTRARSKADGYRLLLAAADREIADARVAVSQHRHGAAARLKAAERFRDGIARKLDSSVPPGDFSLGETLRSDFGPDEDAPR